MRADLTRVLTAMLLTTMFIVSLVVALRLPAAARVPIHFDRNFEPDGWTGRFGLLLLPLISIVSTAVVGGARDSRPTARGRPRVPGWLVLAVACVFLALQATILHQTFAAAGCNAGTWTCLAQTMQGNH